MEVRPRLVWRPPGTPGLARPRGDSVGTRRVPAWEWAGARTGWHHRATVLFGMPRARHLPAVTVGALEGRGGDAVPWPHAVPRHVPSPERLLSPSHVLSLEARAVSPDPCSLRHTLSPKHKLSLWTHPTPPPPRDTRCPFGHQLPLKPCCALRHPLSPDAPSPRVPPVPRDSCCPPACPPPGTRSSRCVLSPPGTRCPSLVVTCPSSL